MAEGEENRRGRMSGAMPKHGQRYTGVESVRDVDILVAHLSGYHRKVTSAAGDTNRDSNDSLRSHSVERFTGAEPLLNTILSVTASDVLQVYASRFHDHSGPSHARGWRKEGVGSSSLREIADVAARFAVDLSLSGRDDLSRHLIESLSEALESPDIPSVAGYYASLHAFREGINPPESVGGSHESGSASDQHPVRPNALQLAARYALFGNEPAAVVIMGRVGAGKSTIAEMFSEHVGWPVLSSDRIRKELAGVELFGRGDSAQRARLYSASMTERTYGAIREKAIDLLSEGSGVVIDATYSNAERRNTLCDSIQRRGFTHLFVELVAGKDQLKERLARRAATSRPISDARPDNFEALDARYEPLRPPEDVPHLSIDTQGTPQQTLFRIIKQIVQMPR